MTCMYTAEVQENKQLKWRPNEALTEPQIKSKVHIKWYMWILGDGQIHFLPREAVGDSNDRGWFLGISHGHVTYFSL